MEAAMPEWDHCAAGATQADATGCRGRKAERYSRCVAHLEQPELVDFLATLSAAADVDFRGLTFDEPLLGRILDAVKAPTDGKPVFGTADFTEAQFTGFTPLRGVEFRSEATFDGARFDGSVDFSRSVFRAGASFAHSIFEGEGSVVFHEATFEGGVQFWDAEFSHGIGIVGARFDGYAQFSGARFRGETYFQGLSFADSVEFEHVTFEGAMYLLHSEVSGFMSFAQATFLEHVVIGPVSGADHLEMVRATFRAPSEVTASARRITYTDVRLEEPAVLEASSPAVELDGAVLLQPLTVASRPAAESRAEAGGFGTAAIVSLARVDAAMLFLHEVDLRRCSFSRARHLDQIRIEGECLFAQPPSATGRGNVWPFHWTQRKVLAEEGLWRARRGPRRGRPGWLASVEAEESGATPGAATIEILYRNLRKALEDGKDEPGAADFYYGEMEMRRHSRGWRTTERWLLQAYWLLSGYGLRAARALGWLSVAMFITILLMMGYGLPDASPAQRATGTVPAGGGKVTFTIDKDDPRNPTGHRFTGERLEKALTVTLNSVVFRSSGQDLTTAGTYIEMASRFSEPVLLGFAALAVRGRVKRGS
ncbi:pentapeptide repeat-containing protein [Streptomyces sp. NPDC047117]|uniref:pentapeptide repeat-containing protein n=1 Tax=Streptomyces sp. NPDC047117 TaxID=3155379 RepID=UPI0033E5D4D7